MAARRRISVLQIVMIVVLVACGALLSFFALRVSNAQNARNSVYEDNQTVIAGLQSSIDALADPAEDKEGMEQLMHSASMIGTYVANYQTQFPSCFQAGDVEKALMENMSALQDYIDESSPMGWRSWFLPASDGQADVLRWRFGVTYEFTNDVLPVLWFCHDTSGELVAFTTGVYSASTNKFSDIRVYATAYGRDSYQPVEADNYDDGSGAVGSNVDIPVGYYFDEYGDLVNGGGVIYEGSNWANQFKEDFGDMMGDMLSRREELLEAGGSDIEGEPDIDIEFREGLQMGGDDRDA